MGSVALHLCLYKRMYNISFSVSADSAAWQILDDVIVVEPLHLDIDWVY